MPLFKNKTNTYHYGQPYMENGRWYTPYGELIRNPDAYFAAVARNKFKKSKSQSYSSSYNSKY